jgi:hypothetical protein
VNFSVTNGLMAFFGDEVHEFREQWSIGQGLHKDPYFASMEFGSLAADCGRFFKISEAGAS